MKKAAINNAPRLLVLLSYCRYLIRQTVLPSPCTYSHYQQQHISTVTDTTPSDIHLLAGQKGLTLVFNNAKFKVYLFPGHWGGNTPLYVIEHVGFYIAI